MTTINTIEDLVRLLDEKPEWAEALRSRLQTRELTELPGKFESFRAEMHQAFADLAQSVQGLADALTATNDRLDKAEEDRRDLREVVEGCLTKLKRNDETCALVDAQAWLTRKQKQIGGLTKLKMSDEACARPLWTWPRPSRVWLMP
jgi:chromosome segregation ATPase